MSKQRVNFILFTGRPTTWEIGAESIKKHIIQRMEAVTGCPVVVLASLHRAEDGSMDDSNAQFAETYKPVKFETFCYTPQNPDHPSITAAYPHARDMPFRTASMFYHMKNAFTMMETYLEEHPELEPLYVMRIRPDIVCFTDMEIEPEPEADMICVPSFISVTGFSSGGYPHDWLPDHMAYSTFDVMKRYCSIYDLIYKEFVPIYLPEYTLMERLIRHGGLKWKPVMLGNYLSSRGEWKSIVEDPNHVRFAAIFHENIAEAKHSNFAKWWPGW